MTVTLCKQQISNRDNAQQFKPKFILLMKSSYVNLTVSRHDQYHDCAHSLLCSPTILSIKGAPSDQYIFIFS